MNNSTARVISARDQAIATQVRDAAALFGRDDLLAVVATGKDFKKFLHAMLTQDVKGLADGTLRTTCLCDPQGAVLATAIQVLGPDRAVLWTERSLAPVLRDTLDRYVIMDEVELSIDDDLALVQLIGATSPALMQRLGLPEPALGSWHTAQLLGMPVDLGQAVAGGAHGSPAGEALPCFFIQLQRDHLGDVAAALIEAGATPGSHAAFETLRIASGWPSLTAGDVDPGSLPLEIGLKTAVDYRKGCYMGQEAIAMMTYRGQIRRHLCWVEREGEALPGAGWQLRDVAGKRAGKMGSAVLLADGRLWGLASVQRKAYAPGAVLTAASDDGTATAQVRIVATTVPSVLSAEGTAA
jgi:aminomethyltransferase